MKPNTDDIDKLTREIAQKFPAASYVTLGRCWEPMADTLCFSITGNLPRRDKNFRLNANVSGYVTISGSGACVEDAMAEFEKNYNYQRTGTLDGWESSAAVAR